MSIDPFESSSSMDPNSTTEDAIKLLIDQLCRTHPDSREGRDLSTRVLKHIDRLPVIDQMYWHKEMRRITRWTKGDIKEIIKDLRKRWKREEVQPPPTSPAIPPGK